MRGDSPGHILSDVRLIRPGALILFLIFPSLFWFFYLFIGLGWDLDTSPEAEAKPPVVRFRRVAPGFCSRELDVVDAPLFPCHSRRFGSGWGWGWGWFQLLKLS
ncbi:hypothetical protein BO86DRAFT_386450, partial [Aspergillus japonicus CBS 114.51]